MSYLSSSFVSRAREWPGNTVDTGASRCCKRTWQRQVTQARRLQSEKILNYQDEEERGKVCARVGGSRGQTEPVLSANLNGVLSTSFFLSRNNRKIFRDHVIVCSLKSITRINQYKVLKIIIEIILFKQERYFIQKFIIYISDKNVCVHDRRKKKKKKKCVENIDVKYKCNI